MQIQIMSASVKSPTKVIDHSPDVRGTLAIFAALAAREGGALLILTLADGKTVAIEAEKGSPFLIEDSESA